MNSKSKKERFLTVLEAHKKIIYKVSQSYARQPEDQQDLIQEITLQLWNSFDRYDPKFKWSTWIYRVALNVSISFYRKEKKRKNNISLSENIIETAEDQMQEEFKNENLNLLFRFIAELNELDKAIIILYLDEKNHDEIANILGISKSNVGTKISRIKLKLKKRFSTI